MEKHVEHDIISAYDEEIIATKESDFKHKQVCAFGWRQDLFWWPWLTVNVEIQGMDAHVAVLPSDWSHLRRHWVHNSLKHRETEHTYWQFPARARSMSTRVHLVPIHRMMICSVLFRSSSGPLPWLLQSSTFASSYSPTMKAKAVPSPCIILYRAM